MKWEDLKIGQYAKFEVYYDGPIWQIVKKISDTECLGGDGWLYSLPPAFNCDNLIQSSCFLDDDLTIVEVLEIPECKVND